MKKIKMLLLGICLYAVGYAQNNTAYHLFTFNGKSGVTDTAGNEIVPPIYNYDYDNIYPKWVLKSKNEALVFNVITGEKEIYEDYQVRYLNYADTAYARVKKNGTYYLQNRHSATVYPLPKDRVDINITGKYFYLKVAKPLASKPQKLAAPLVNHILLYQNPSQKNPVLSVAASEVISLWSKENFYLNKKSEILYYAFKEGKLINLYDAQLKWIQQITLSTDCEYCIEQEVAKALQIELGYNPSDFYPVANPGPVKYPKLKAEQKDGNLFFYLEKYAADLAPTLLFTTHYDEYKIKYKHRVVLSNFNQPVSLQFDVDLATGKIFFPKKLLPETNLIFVK